MHIALIAAGAFSVLLGTLHFFFPALLDFRGAIPLGGPSLKPFQLPFYRYQTLRSDVYGIAWFMNHCVSFVIVSIGAADLFSASWLKQPFGPLLAAWIAAWWFLRALCQLYLGRRRGDWLVMGFFAALGFLHAAAALHTAA